MTAAYAPARYPDRMDVRRTKRLWGYPIDLLFIFGFWFVYSLAQDQPTALAVLLPTVFPFWLALSIGWLLSRQGRRTLHLEDALTVWATTLIGGLVLRNLGGEATAMRLIVVTTIILSFTLLGWRLIGFLILHTRARSTSA
ncbi:hypothetical protein GCM10009702_16770 [Propioniferax innocua]